jgi:hypothetical protein
MVMIVMALMTAMTAVMKQINRQQHRPLPRSREPKSGNSRVQHRSLKDGADERWWQK